MYTLGAWGVYGRCCVSDSPVRLPYPRYAVAGALCRKPLGDKGSGGFGHLKVGAVFGLSPNRKGRPGVPRDLPEWHPGGYGSAAWCRWEGAGVSLVARGARSAGTAVGCREIYTVRTQSAFAAFLLRMLRMLSIQGPRFSFTRADTVSRVMRSSTVRPWSIQCRS